MPAQASSNNRKMTDFFKPFTIPKNRTPVNDVIEDEIIVSSERHSSPRPRNASSPTKKHGSQDNLSSPGIPSSQTIKLPTRVSPKKPSTTVTPQKRSSPAQTEASDLTPTPISPNSAQRRNMGPAEIPSPSRRLPATATQLPAAQRREEQPRAQSTSFSSISTLSSLPQSSTSSSRRIMKNGVKAVTNSDSGSGDSDSDDLADPSTFIVRKRRKTPPPGSDANHGIEVQDSSMSERQSTRKSDAQKRSSWGYRSASRPSPPPKIFNQDSILALVKQRQKEESTAARMKAAEAAFLESQKQRAEHMKHEQDLSNGLRIATADDSDEVDRMMLAMQRTEALQEDAKFFYFRAGGTAGTEGFPSLSNEESRPWMKLLGSDRSRKQTFISGFMALIATREQLPDDLCQWVAAQLLVETSSDLCDAYTEVLQKCALHPSPLHDRLSRLSYFYSTLAILGSEKHHDRTTIPAKPPQGLQNVLQTVQVYCTADAASSDLIASTVVELMVAGADDNVRHDPSLLNEIHETIQNILKAASEGSSFEEICEEVHRSLFDQTYLSQHTRCRVVTSLPAYSQRTHHLRRSLALHLVTDLTGEKEYCADLDSEDWVDTIIDQLKTGPDFSVSRSSDYAILDSMTQVLDIAIDAGFSQSNFRSVEPPAKTTLRPGKPTMSTAEASFNSRIDRITQQLQLMSSRIMGSGTSHLRRTEAKGSLERLIMRLEHSVRTRPKPRKGIFGDVTGQQRDFLDSFLKPKIIKEDDLEDEESDSASVVPYGMLEGREVGGDTDTVSGAESTGKRQ